MKKVTTNITFGQIFFILLTFAFSSLMFFYLGAKFGPAMLSIGDQYDALDVSFLPDEKQAAEIKKLLKIKKPKFSFYDSLQDSKPSPQINEKNNTDQATETTPKKEKPSSVATKETSKDNSEVLKKEKEVTVKYSLQLGSYSSQKRAERAKAKWKKRGFSSKIVVTSVAGKGKWYRLRLGNYASLDNVLTSQKKIMSKYRQGSQIIKLKKQ